MAKKEAYAGFLTHLGRFASSTQNGYEGAVKRFLDAAPDDLETVTAEDIERHILSLRKRLKASTCNQVLTRIKSFFRYLTDYRGMPNPALKVKLLKQLPPRQRILSREEYQKVITATSGHRRNMLVFLGNSGLRASEFLSLRDENIADGFITVLSTKTRKLRRVPINANIRAILDANPSFFNLSKNHSYKWLFKQCRKAARQAGIPPFSTHSLRHYFITQMVTGAGDISKAVPLNIVAKIVGDKPETLNAVYIHIFDADLKGTTDCLK